MRVVFDCRMSTWTGVGRYTVGLARALAARPDVDLVQVVAVGETPPVADGRAEVLVAHRHPFSLAAAGELARLAREARPGVVHCAHFPTPIPAPHPLVVTLHDLSPLLVPGVMPSLAKRGVYRWWNGRASSVADRIVVPSLHTEADVVRCFPAAAGKTVVTLEAADDFADGAHEPLARTFAHRLAQGRYVLAMGSTRAHKDLPTLLAAFSAIAARHDELRLVLVGAEQPGYLERELPAAPPDVLARIEFSGPVTDGQLRTLYAGAALFAFPSRYEGFGLPPLEAMALGAPVVAADATSIPEVVDDAGLLVAPGDAAAFADAIERVLGDEELRRGLVAAGLARAASLTWANTAEATVAAYRAAGARA